LKNESKEELLFWTFFQTNLSLWSAAAWCLQGQKSYFCEFKNSYLVIHLVEIFEFFSRYSSQHTTRSYGYMCSKMFLFQNLVLVLEMVVLKCFWWKHSHDHVEIKLRKWSLTRYISTSSWNFEKKNQIERIIAIASSI